MATLAEIEDGKIVVEAHGRDKDLIRLVPGAKWRNERWECRLTWSTCKALRGILGENLEIGDRLYEWASEEYSSRVGPCLEMRQATEVSDTGGLCDGLYPFQQAGAQFLMTAQQALLADPMGSGKTVQAAAAARNLQERGVKHHRGEGSLPALVVCPKSMVGTWKKEIEKWWPGTRAAVVQGAKKKRIDTIWSFLDEPGVCIINWESVRLHSRLEGYGSMRLTAEERAAIGNPV